jgi:hypothetical protein
MSRAAERILTKSLADIEGGNWCQKELGAVQHEDGALLDYLSEHTVQTHGAPVKNMACAVGLLSLYGDKNLTTISFEFQGQTYSYTTNLQYPTVESPKPIRDCVDALYAALPQKARRALIRECLNNGSEAFETWDESTGYYRPMKESEFGIEQKQNIIVAYNDLSTTTQKTAIRWFRKALTFIQEANAARASKYKTTTTKANLKTALKGA